MKPAPDGVRALQATILIEVGIRKSLIDTMVRLNTVGLDTSQVSADNGELALNGLIRIHGILNILPLMKQCCHSIGHA
jgi:hypothetical protein